MKPPCFGPDTRIEHLALCRPDIKDLRELGHLGGLQTLTLWGARGLTDISSLGGCSQLKRLRLHGCPNLSDLSVLARLPSLTSLSLVNIAQPPQASALAALGALESLNLDDVRGTVDLRHLAGLAALRELDLGDCDVAGLEALMQLPSLRLLRLPQLPSRVSRGVFDFKSLLDDVARIMGLKNAQRLHDGDQVPTTCAALAIVTVCLDGDRFARWEDAEPVLRQALALAPQAMRLRLARGSRRDRTSMPQAHAQAVAGAEALDRAFAPDALLRHLFEAQQHIPPWVTQLAGTLQHHAALPHPDAAPRGETA